jgi:hypothetical protein
MALKTRVLACVVALAGLSAVMPAWAAPIVSISAPGLPLSVGAQFEVDVVISDVTDLFGFQFDLVFKPGVLAAGDVSEGEFLPLGGNTLFLPGSIDNTLGTINLTVDTLLSNVAGVSGSGVLATVAFTALGAGTSLLSPSFVILIDSTLSDIAATATNGVVNIGQSAVPEPNTIVLMLVGVVASIAFRKRA